MQVDTDPAPLDEEDAILAAATKCASSLALDAGWLGLLGRQGQEQERRTFGGPNFLLFQDVITDMSTGSVHNLDGFNGPEYKTIDPDINGPVNLELFVAANQRLQTPVPTT